MSRCACQKFYRRMDRLGAAVECNHPGTLRATPPQLRRGALSPFHLACGFPVARVFGLHRRAHRVRIGHSERPLTSAILSIMGVRLEQMNGSG